MKGLGEADPAKVASLKEQLNAKLDVYDKILAKQPYLAGQVNQNKDIFRSFSYLINLGIYFGRSFSSPIWHMAC